PAERAALDRAILAVYRQAGVTAGPATHHRPAPLLRDLATTLRTDPDAAAHEPAAPPAPGGARSLSALVHGPATPPPARAPGAGAWWCGRGGSCPTSCAPWAHCSRWTPSGGRWTRPAVPGWPPDVWSWWTRRGF